MLITNAGCSFTSTGGVGAAGSAALHLAALRKASPNLIALNHILLLTAGIFRNDNYIKIFGGRHGT